MFNPVLLLLIFFSYLCFAMAALTTTIEDTSPLISYSSGWLPGDSSLDDLASQYSSSNFMATKTMGATMAFTFNGSAVAIYGARRPNHGRYQIKLDGEFVAEMDGHADQDKLQQELYSVDGLDASRGAGPHTIELTNLEQQFLDVDFITWDSSVDDDTIVHTWQDTDTAFAYDSDWSTNVSNAGSFLGGTGHTASISGSAAHFTFAGTGVTLYGPVGPTYGAYSVYVDGVPIASNNGTDLAEFSANKTQYSAKEVLFHASGLADAQHVLDVVSQSDEGEVAVDFALTYATGAEESSSGGITKGTIAGVVVGSVAFLFFALLALYWTRILARNRRGGGRARGLIGRRPTFGKDITSANEKGSGHILPVFDWSRSTKRESAHSWLSIPAGPPAVIAVTAATPFPGNAIPSPFPYTGGPVTNASSATAAHAPGLCINYLNRPPTTSDAPLRGYNNARRAQDSGSAGSAKELEANGLRSAGGASKGSEAETAGALPPDYRQATGVYRG
ncbi:hypothetical protein HDZ31DRAFT_73608 [Schizophyllum fasciatum]